MIPGQTLPAGWCWTTLGELGSLDRGRSKHRPRDDVRLFGGPYPFIQTSEVKHSHGHIREYRNTYSEFGLRQSRLWPAGTLCITIAANIAETGILTFDACFPDSVVGFLPNQARASSEFVQFYLRSIKAELAAAAPATAQKNINLKLLDALEIPLPPVGEQQRIVAEIESQLTRLDAATSSLRQVRLKLNRFRAAVLHAACEGRIGTARKSRWTNCVLADVIGEVRNGISVKPSATEGLRILRISAVRPLKADIGDVRFLPAISPDFEPYLLRPSDLLFTRYNGNPDYVGVVACLKELAEPTVYPDKLIRVRLADTARVLPEFLEIILNAGHAREFLRSRIRTTAGQSGISGQDLRLMPISFPDLPEQPQIVAEVQRRLSGADLVERTVDNNLKRASRLRQSILKRAFDGRLVPQDAMDELPQILPPDSARNGRPSLEGKG